MRWIPVGRHLRGFGTVRIFSAIRFSRRETAEIPLKWPAFWLGKAP